jgi:beta-glucanase (GH16 family)
MRYQTFDPPLPIKQSHWVYWVLTAGLLAIVFICRYFISAQPLEPQMLGKSADRLGWELVWAEEFEGDCLNRSTWHLETINGEQSGNNELEIYTTREVNSPVSMGKLHIRARNERFEDWRFTSARLTTQYSFSFTYGRVEARFQNPKGRGLWPAFWMLGSSIVSTPWPACGEVDIMEMVGGPSWPGGGDDRVVGTAHWLGKVRTQVKRHKWSLTDGPVYDGGSITTAALPGSASLHPHPFRSPFSVAPPLHAAFHIIALEWNETHFVWFLDDVMFKLKRIDDITDPGLAAFHQPFFLLLNLAIGGNWPGPPDAETLSNFPHEFIIDYIRVYQKRQALGESPTISHSDRESQELSRKHHSRERDTQYRDRHT